MPQLAKTARPQNFWSMAVIRVPQQQISDSTSLSLFGFSLMLKLIHMVEDEHVGAFDLGNASRSCAWRACILWLVQDIPNALQVHNANDRFECKVLRKVLVFKHSDEGLRICHTGCLYEQMSQL